MRLILEMSEEVMNKIEHLVKITKSKNKADAIGKTLSVYDYLLKEIDLGSEIILRNETVETKVNINFMEK
jgi:hypothetical protein